MKFIKRTICIILTLAFMVTTVHTAVFATNDTYTPYAVEGGNIYFGANSGELICSDKTITQADIPSEINGVSVQIIGQSAFSGCKSLTNVSIPDSVRNIGNDAFHNCNALKSITIPDGVTLIGNGTFSGCTSLTNITIPTSVTEIGSFAFEYCEALKSITIPSSVTSIGFGTFWGCKSLTRVTIPNSVTCIESSTFQECTSLSSVSIPASVTYIDLDVFYDCKELTDINVSPESTSYTSADGILFSKNIDTLLRYPDGKTDTSYTIPNTVKSIKYMAFSNCESLTNVYIPSSVIDINGGAFNACTNITSFDVEPTNTSYTSVNGILFSKSIDDIIKYPTGKTNTSYTIPSSVIAIGSEAFSGCKALSSIAMPSNVTTIDNWAFRDCNALTSITIPSTVTSIGVGAFYNCTSLRSVTIPNSVTQIGDVALGYFQGDESDDFTIIGFPYSEAEAYAKKKDFKFIPISDNPADTLVTVPPCVSPVTMDEKAITLNAYTFTNSDGGAMNYVMLRDIAYLLNGTNSQFEVSWEPKTGISITTGRPYTAVGGELVSKGSNSKTYATNKSSISINGKSVVLEGYTIESNNYFKLRDLGEAIDFNVSWNSSTGEILINSNEAYSDEA